MAKQLKLWNGTVWTGLYNHATIFVAAFSAKQAAELISEACGTNITAYNINKYYHKGSWGNRMNEIIPTEPCVYVSQNYIDKPKRLI